MHKDSYVYLKFEPNIIISGRVLFRRPQIFIRLVMINSVDIYTIIKIYFSCTDFYIQLAFIMTVMVINFDTCSGLLMTPSPKE